MKTARTLLPHVPRPTSAPPPSAGGRLWNRGRGGLGGRGTASPGSACHCSRSAQHTHVNNPMSLDTTCDIDDCLQLQRLYATTTKNITGTHMCSCMWKLQLCKKGWHMTPRHSLRTPAAAWVVQKRTHSKEHMFHLVRLLGRVCRHPVAARLCRHLGHFGIVQAQVQRCLARSTLQSHMGACRYGLQSHVGTCRYTGRSVQACRCL